MRSLPSPAQPCGVIPPLSSAAHLVCGKRGPLRGGLCRDRIPPVLLIHDGLCPSLWRALPLGCAVAHAYDTLQGPRVTLGRAAADALPTVPRHKVRVRGVETEFCKRGQRIPEWWHFPECDRHYYFAPGDDASSSAPTHAHVMPPLALP
jgi:hypothetical protein